jgi:hypothetical protein
MWAWCGSGLWSYKKGRSPLLHIHTSAPLLAHQAALVGVHSGLRAARFYAPQMLR